MKKKIYESCRNIFLFYHGNACCVYSLESLQRGCLSTVMVCLFFLLVSLVDYDLSLWLFLDIFYASLLFVINLIYNIMPLVSIRFNNCFK